MVVTGPENIFYLTGQQTPGYYIFQALVLPVEGDPVFVIRQLEYFNFIANTFISDCDDLSRTARPGRLPDRGSCDKGLARQARRHRQARLVPAHRGLRGPAVAQLGAIGDAAGIVEKLRAVKSPLELEKLERAAAYVDAGMKAGAGRP